MNLRPPAGITLDPGFVEQWGAWCGRALAAMDWVEDEACLWPLVAVAPEFAKQVIGRSRYLAYNLRLEPGSLVLGFWAASVDGIKVQIRDLALGHNYFQEPIPLESLRSIYATGTAPSLFLLATPGPVVGDGLFKFEFFGDEGTRVFVDLAIAGVRECPRS